MWRWAVGVGGRECGEERREELLASRGAAAVLEQAKPAPHDRRAAGMHALMCGRGWGWGARSCEASSRLSPLPARLCEPCLRHRLCHGGDDLKRLGHPAQRDIHAAVGTAAAGGEREMPESVPYLTLSLSSGRRGVRTAAGTAGAHSNRAAAERLVSCVWPPGTSQRGASSSLGAHWCRGQSVRLGLNAALAAPT